MLAAARTSADRPSRPRWRRTRSLLPAAARQAAGRANGSALRCFGAPPTMWPIAVRLSTWSQTILNTASSGTLRNAPGMPHSQSQNSSEAITSTGFRVKRLASSSGVTVSPSSRWMAK